MRIPLAEEDPISEKTNLVPAQAGASVPIRCEEDVASNRKLGLCSIWGSGLTPQPGPHL